MSAPLPVVRMEHVRQVRRNGGKRVCAPGIETWCKANGIDIEALATTGVPGETMAALHDMFADQAVAIAVAEEEQAHGR